MIDELCSTVPFSVSVRGLLGDAWIGIVYCLDFMMGFPPSVAGPMMNSGELFAFLQNRFVMLLSIPREKVSSSTVESRQGWDGP